MRLSEILRTNDAHFLLLFLSGFALILATSLHCQISWIPMSLEFGLLQMLPLSFWIGFAIMIISTLAFLGPENENVFFAKAFLIFLVAWGLPVFFESNVSGWDSFQHMDFANATANNNYLNDLGTSSYLSWPGAFIYIRALSNLTPLDYFSFLKYYRLFSVGFTFLAFFVLLKKILPANYRIGSLLITFFPVWIAHFHVSPQSLGLPMMVMALSTLFFKKPIYWFIGVIFTAWLLLSHPTTTSVAIAMTFVWCVVSFVYWFLLHERAPAKFFSHPVSAVFIFILLLATIFLFNQYINELVDFNKLPFISKLNNAGITGTEEKPGQTIQKGGIISEINNRTSFESNPTQSLIIGEIISLKEREKKLGLDSEIFIGSDSNRVKFTGDLNQLEEMRDQNVTAVISIAPALGLGSKIRAFSIISLSLLTAIYMFSWFWIKGEKEKVRYLFLFSCFLTIFLMVQLSSTLFAKLGAFTDRILIYSSVFFMISGVCLSEMLPKKLGKALLGALLLLSLLNFSTAYYNETLMVVSDQIEDSSKFISEYASPVAKIWSGLFPFRLKGYQQFRGRSFIDNWVFQDIPYGWENWAAFTDHDFLWDRRWGMIGPNSLANEVYSNSLNKIMDNIRVRVYYFK